MADLNLDNYKALSDEDMDEVIGGFGSEKKMGMLQSVYDAQKKCRKVDAFNQNKQPGARKKPKKKNLFGHGLLAEEGDNYMC